MLTDLGVAVKYGHAGNGLHIHFVPVAEGEPLPVRASDGSLSDAAQWLIAGLVEMGGALMAFGNRVRGSFARLQQAKEAPNSIFWGEFDRSALIRLPIVARGTGGRAITTPTIEFRLPDGSALPHLLLGGAALAMVHGRTMSDIDAVLRRTSAHGEELDGGAALVPRSFAEIADAVERHRGILERDGVFPASLVDHLMAALRDQFRGLL